MLKEYYNTIKTPYGKRCSCQFLLRFPDINFLSLSYPQLFDYAYCLQRIEGKKRFNIQLRTHLFQLWDSFLFGDLRSLQRPDTSQNTNNFWVTLQSSQ